MAGGRIRGRAGMQEVGEKEGLQENKQDMSCSPNAKQNGNRQASRIKGERPALKEAQKVDCD